MRFRLLTAGALLAAALAPGCSGRSYLETSLADAGDDAGVVDAATPEPPPTRSDKLDLLLVVDNSRNLDTAQDLLVRSLPYLLDRLTRPACVNGLGNVVATTTTPTDPCPVGVRDFAPLADVHIGVITTSLGGHGADICSPKNPSFDPTQNDHAQLITRGAGGGVVPTYDNKGFLAWDPGQAMNPPGDSDIAMFGAKLAEIVGGAGTKGCGFESQLESIYRFLVDPAPYQDIVVQDGQAVPVGVDQVLLQQRADFLRPDSVVAVVLLSDENDCSTHEGGQYFLSNQGVDPSGKPFRMPRGRSVCKDNPDDPCCVSCGQPTPAGCTPAENDPACVEPVTVLDDAINLRCFDQKRRFGLDFLYPVSRYVEAFTSAKVADREGQIVKNPLFSGGRPASFFFLEGIVGVPWEDLAVDPKSLGSGYKPAFELDWNLLLPNEKTGAPPADPLMVESIDPRTGTQPVTGAALAPPSATDPQANPINGHERNIPARDDLQYACIYPMAAPVDCNTQNPACDCKEGAPTNPICQAKDGTYSSVQRYARALPGTRELEVLRGLGMQAIAGSICAEKATGAAQATFGYKPAFDALLRTIRWRLQPAD